jgi:hypothetical protein
MRYISIKGQSLIISENSSHENPTEYPDYLLNIYNVIGCTISKDTASWPVYGSYPTIVVSRKAPMQVDESFAFKEDDTRDRFFNALTNMAAGRTWDGKEPQAGRRAR